MSADDAAWIAKHFETFNRLASKSEPFRLALEAAIDWRFAKEPRVAVGRLWSGIEAVFGITSELVYRISILTSCSSRSKEGTFSERTISTMRSLAERGTSCTEQPNFTVQPTGCSRCSHSGC